MKNSHSYSLLNYHFVFTTKYRKIFPPEVDKKAFESFLIELCADVIEFEISTNHIHILCELHPSVSAAKFAEIFKSQTSKFLRRNFSQWFGWRTGYFVRTVSSDNNFTVINYIQNQNRKV